MKTFKSIGVVTIFFALIIIVQSFTMLRVIDNKSSSNISISDSSLVLFSKSIELTDPSCLQMYYYIERYSDTFNIPKNYAYGIAFYETGYKGPFDWSYNHRKSSHAGAVGPMQIMPSTASLINDRKVPTSFLKNNVEYNVRTSLKLLRRLHDKYGDWKVVFGAYNSGKPIINNYARKVYRYNPEWMSVQN
jgi:hypothetical protein